MSYAEPSPLDARLAELTIAAADLGYTLVPEPVHPDSPHADLLREHVIRILKPVLNDVGKPHFNHTVSQLMALVITRAPATVAAGIEKAYGSLWRDLGTSEYATRARRELLALLTFDRQGSAVMWAIEEFGQPKPTHQDTPKETVSTRPDYDLMLARVQDVIDAMSPDEKKCMADGFRRLILGEHA